MDDEVQGYIDAIDPANRPLFDRLHHLILEVRPDVEVVLSYKMPTYKAGRRRLHLAAWRHGVSLYGWGERHAADFTARHPELKTGKGTIQLGPADATGLTDDEFRDLSRDALEA